MKPSSPPNIGQACPQPLAVWLFALALALLPAAGLRADTSATALHLTNTGRDTEALPTFRLDWAATSNSTYLVQSATSLAPGATWGTLDAVTSAGQAGSYQLQVTATDSTGLSSPPAAFYRLILPQPQITSVEPAIVPPGSTNDFYVIGQCFPTNAVLQINGVTQAGAVVVSSSLATVPGFVPDVPGNYRVALLVGGAVISSFTVVCVDALANPELVLQGPPTLEPPASPQTAALISFWLSKKGYDYYKAQSDYSFDIEQALNIGSQSTSAGAGKKDFKGHVTLMKAFDDGGDGESARKYTKTGHVTLMKVVDDGSDDARKGSGPGGTGGNGGAGGNATGGAIYNRVMNGVVPFSGEIQECAVDLAIPGRELDFVWARTYHSRLGRTGAAANGWTFSYDVSCAQNSAGGIDVYDGTGRKDTFTLGTNGTYTCPELFREGTLSNNTFTLTFADTGRWVFNPFDGSATAGKGHQIITRNGSTMTLGYNPSGRLAQVVDDLGRTNTVAYNSSGQLASVTDFAGRSVNYQYYAGAKSDNGSAGDLASVTSPPVTGTPNGNDFPSGKTTTYTYSKSFPLDRENHLLLTVTDPKGQTAAVFTYEHSSTSANYLRCIAAQEGTNTASCFTYSAFTGRPHVPVLPASWCIVNDPGGNVTQYYFDARNRCLIEDDYTGRATPGLPVTATVNRPTGQVRSTDPAYYETTWSWNNDSLCTAETSPGGQQMQYVYQSDFDPATTARKRADCRVVREIASSAVDLDGDGVADASDRSWHFDYDPRFGSSQSSSEWYKWRKAVLDGKVDRRSISVIFHNDAGEEAAYHAINTKGTGGNTGRLRESPTKSSLRESPSKGSLRLRESPTLASTGQTTLRESPTKQSLRESPTLPSKGQTTLRESPTKASLGFCTSATDPRGNVTTGAYDANGNRVKVKFYWDRQSGAEADFTYDTHGQLTAITNAPDANGHSRVDTFSYYSSGSQAGQLQSIAIDESGVHLTSTFEYDACGNVTRCVDPRTNDWLFTYNSLDQCVRAQSPPNISARCATDFAYDANDNLVSCTTQLRDADDNLVATPVDRASYDSLNQLTELALAVDASHAVTNRFVYDGNGECVQALGPDAVSGADPHQMVAYQYDERGLLFREAAAPGTGNSPTNEYSYNPNGQTVRINKIEALVVKQRTLAYDGFARLATTTDEMGNQSVCFYDANDNPKNVRLFGELNDVAGSAGNVRLAESRYEYDGLDRCFRTHDLFFNPATQSPIGSGDAVSSCVFAPNGECVSATDSLGRTTSFAYDTACRLLSVTDARGDVAVSVRDRFGNVTSLTSTELPDIAGSPQVFTTTYAYDSLNRCVSDSDNVGNTGTCAYDSLGRVVRETNPNGNDTTYAYDLLGDCLVCVSYAGSSSGTKPIVVRSSSAAYDTSSRCLTSTDPNGNTTSYAYDTLGNCTTVTEADGTHQQFVWSPRSNLMAEQDANGTTVTNGYDLCDRIIHRDIAARGAAVATTTFETFAYDGSSLLVLASNDVSQVNFSYDSFGDCTGSSQDGLAQSATYDSEGNPLSLTYPGGRVVAYAYDVLDQVTNVSTSANGVSHPQLARFAYAGPGRLARIGRDNGINTRVDWNGLANPANSAGDYGWQEVSRVRDGSVASPSLVCDVTGTYSRAQSKLTRADAGRTSLTLTYDALEQLVEASDSVQPRDTMYALDAAGNRSHVITNGVLMTPDYAMSSALPPGDFQMNRYTTTPFGAQSYDANGNLVVRANAASPTFYHYDYADRLVEVDALSTLGTLAPVATFTYDALGNRISKTSYPGVPAAPVTTQYVNDVVGYKDGEDGTMHTRPGNHKPGKSSILEERSGGQVTHLWCWGPSCRAGGDLNRDGMPDVVVAFTATDAPQYYHCDDLGNVLALTDAGGNVLERYAYDDYGAVTFLTSDGFPTSAMSSAVGNPYCWGGLRLDAETGLHNNDGGGYFDPQTGRRFNGTPHVPVLPMSLQCGMVGNNPWSPNNPPPPVAYKVKAMGANGEGKKEYVGHVSLLK